MAGNDLKLFREKWKHEIQKKHLDVQIAVEHSKDNTECKDDVISQRLRDKVYPIKKDATNSSSSWRDFDISKNFQTFSKKPRLETIALLTLEIPSYQQKGRTYGSNEMRDNSHAPLTNYDGHEDLLSLLIRDIDETTSIPFFDITLPKEVCIKIFSQLDVIDLCRCSCVSKAWASIASDELIWYHAYKRLGFKDGESNMRELVGWKSIVRDRILRRRVVTQNWRERICQIQTLEYEKGVCTHPYIEQLFDNDSYLRLCSS